MIRKAILHWLLGEDIEQYIELLKENIEIRKKYIEEIEEHLKTLKMTISLCEEQKSTIKITRKLLQEALKVGAKDDRITNN